MPFGHRGFGGSRNAPLNGDAPATGCNGAKRHTQRDATGERQRLPCQDGVVYYNTQLASSGAARFYRNSEMLTENDVVKSVAAYLTQQGWNIQNICSTNQHGVDILAEKQGKTLAVEAKGGTSATKGTKRYGKPFTGNQKRTHVAVALLTATQVVSEGTYAAAIAFPDDHEHSRLIEKILPALRTLKIRIFVVAENGKAHELIS